MLSGGLDGAETDIAIHYREQFLSTSAAKEVALKLEDAMILLMSHSVQQAGRNTTASGDPDLPLFTRAMCRPQTLRM